MEETKENYLENGIIKIEKGRGIFKKNKIVKAFIVLSVVSTVINLFLIHKFFEVLFSAM